MRLKHVWGLVAVGWTGYVQISGSLRSQDSAFLNDKKNQISEYNQMFYTIFIDDDFMGQNGGMPVICNGWLIRKRFLNSFNFLVKIVGFEIVPVLSIPFFTLPAMLFSLAVGVAAGFLPALLTYIWLEPLSADRTGPFAK